MKLEFEPVASLPRLAWCARVRRGEEVVRVRHGSWVETRDDCFFEGAWDGQFDAYRFDEAVMLAGSGGRLSKATIVFAAPSHMLERIYSIQVGDDLYVSNSFTFLLVEADDEPDPAHPNDFFDFLKHYRRGIRVTGKRLRTNNRRRWQLARWRLIAGERARLSRSLSLQSRTGRVREAVCEPVHSRVSPDHRHRESPHWQTTIPLAGPRATGLVFDRGSAPPDVGIELPLRLSLGICQNK